MDVKAAPVQRMSVFRKESRRNEGDFTVALGDTYGGPLDRDGVEVEDMGKGLEMMRCFERGE